MYFKDIAVPQDVTLEISGDMVTAKGAKGEVKKRLELTKEIKIERVDGKIKVSSESEKRFTKALVGTTIAHIRNAMEGASKGYVYKMRIIYSHFPVTVKIEGDKVIVNNFLGERVPRIAKILGKTEVKVDQQDVTVTGINLDEVSQTAANIEQTCRIVGYDKKIFQDGIYITVKGE